MASFERHVTHRCPHQREHHALTALVTCDHQSTPHALNADDRFCVNPRYIPVLEIPCDECYSIESFWRRIPWEPDSRTDAEMSAAARVFPQPQEGASQMRVSDQLTNAQRAALAILVDGKEHETWRRASGGQVIQRVNHTAAASLAMMGLVYCRYSSGRQQYAIATDAGLLVANAECAAARGSTEGPQPEATK